MKKLADYINESQDVLSHDLTEGDWIEFDTKGTTIIAVITKLDEEANKLTCKMIGWRGNGEEPAKKEYSLNLKSRKVWKLNVSDEQKEKISKLI